MADKSKDGNKSKDGGKSEDGFFKNLLDTFMGEDGSSALGDGLASEAAEDVKLRREWRRQKVDAMTRGEDFPSFSKWKAQQKRNGG